MTLLIDRRSALALGAAFALLPHAGRAQEIHDVVQMTKGDPDAPVTLVAYESFTCGACKNFHETVMPEIEKNFIEPGRVHFIFREAYRNRLDVLASAVARCAPRDRFFPMVDLLYSVWNPLVYESLDAADKELRSLGRQAGLTDAEVEECLSSREYQEALVNQFMQNATQDGLADEKGEWSTPTFFINGEKFSNMSYAEFSEALEGAGA